MYNGAYSDPVITLGVLRLFRKNKSDTVDRVFHSLYKVGRNGNVVFKGFNNSKKKVTSSGARPGARDYCWFNA